MVGVGWRRETLAKMIRRDIPMMRRKGHEKTWEKSIPRRGKIKCIGPTMATCGAGSKRKGQPEGPEQGERGKERRRKG